MIYTRDEKKNKTLGLPVLCCLAHIHNNNIINNTIYNILSVTI